MTRLVRYLLGDDKAQKVLTRTILGQHWYMASDLCMFLGIVSYSQAVRKHVDEKDTLKETHYTGGANRRILLVNNSGLQKLLQVARSERAAEIRERARNIPEYLKVEPCVTARNIWHQSARHLAPSLTEIFQSQQGMQRGV